MKKMFWINMFFGSIIGIVVGLIVVIFGIVFQTNSLVMVIGAVIVFISINLFPIFLSRIKSELEQI